MAAPNYGPPHTIMTETSGPAPIVNVYPPEVNITLTPTIDSRDPVINVRVEPAPPPVAPPVTVYVYNLGDHTLQTPKEDSIVIVRAKGDVQMMPVGPFIAPFSPAHNYSSAKDSDTLTKKATVGMVEYKIGELEANINRTLVSWAAQLPRKEEIDSITADAVVLRSDFNEMTQHSSGEHQKLVKEVSDLRAEVSKLKQVLKRKQDN